MESDDEISNLEPQLTYWNPQFKGDGTFPSQSDMPVQPICPIQILAVNPNFPILGDISEPHIPILELTSNSVENQSLLPQGIEKFNPSMATETNADSSIPEQTMITDLGIVQMLRQESTSMSSRNDSAENSTSKQEEVIKAAKSLFSKRTRTLYNWMYPGQSKAKLKTVVSRAWDTLPQSEKHIYVSQVLGRFGLQASNLMVNPQLRGIRGWTDECNKTQEDEATTKKPKEKAVDGRKKRGKKEKSSKNPIGVRRKYKKRVKKEEYEEEEEDNDQIDSSSEFDKQESIALERLKQIEEELKIHCFDEDPELNHELEEFRMLTEDEELELWEDMPEPDELFSDLNF